MLALSFKLLPVTIKAFFTPRVFNNFGKAVVVDPGP